MASRIPERPGKNGKRGNGPKKTTHPNGQKAPGQPPIVPPSPDEANETQKREEDTRPAWKRLIAKITFERVGIVFAIGYAVVTFLQWRDTNRNFRVDERAWVAPYQMCVEPIFGIPDPQTGCASIGSDDRQVVFKVLFKNTGKTFALNYQVVINPPSLALETTVAPVIAGTKTILAPEQIAHVTLPAIPRSWLETVGRKPIFIRGKMWYYDIFGHPHWTEFCYAHLAANMQPGFGMCEKYNDCDDCNTDAPEPTTWWKFWK